MTIHSFGLQIQNRNPGPRIATKTTAVVPARAIQPRDRSIASGALLVAGYSGFWRSSVIHASAEAPPNDAAAAEIRTNSGLTGLNAPAAT